VADHGGAEGWRAAFSLLIQQTRQHVTRDSHVGSERYSDERVVISLDFHSCGSGVLVQAAPAHPPAPAVRLLDQTLVEEKKTDETVSKIAEGAVNAEAA
jgi:hypothetical protein